MVDHLSWGKFGEEGERGGVPIAGRLHPEVGGILLADSHSRQDTIDIIEGWDH